MVIFEGNSKLSFSSTPLEHLIRFRAVYWLADQLPMLYSVFIIQLSYCPTSCFFVRLSLIVSLSRFFPLHLSCLYFTLRFFLLWVFAVAAAAWYGYVKPLCVCGVKAWHVIRFSAAQVGARLGIVGFCSLLISPEQRTMSCQLKTVTRGLVSICSKRKGIFEE